jgi:hypothetical protein
MQKKKKRTLWITIVKCVFPTPFSFIYNKKKNRRSHNQVQLEKKNTLLTYKQRQPGLSSQARKPDY